MPFFGHIDIISTYERAYSSAFENVNVLVFTQPLAHFIEVINLLVYSIFFPKTNLIPFTNILEINESVRLNMFFFKLPYLFFDIASLLILRKIIPVKNKNKILLQYFLNPILIFAVYVFGRYETIPIFFILLMLFFNKNGKWFLSALSFAMVLLSRTSLLILIPVIILTTGRSLFDKVKYITVALGPYIFIFLYKLFFLKETGELKWVSGGHHLNFFFNMSFDINYNEIIYLFFVVSSLLLLFIVANKWNKKLSWVEQSTLYLIQMLIFFITANYHPQYLTWMLPFLFIFIAYNQNQYKLMIKLIFLISLALIPLLLTWGVDIYMKMFGPIGSWISEIDLLGLINKYISHIRIANIARSFMMGSYIYMLFIVCKSYRIKYHMNKVKRFE